MLEKTKSLFLESVSVRRLWRSNSHEMSLESRMLRVRNLIRLANIISSISCMIRRISSQNEAICDSDDILVLSKNDLWLRRYMENLKSSRDIDIGSNSIQYIAKIWKKLDLSYQRLPLIDLWLRSWRYKIIRT